VRKKVEQQGKKDAKGRRWWSAFILNAAGIRTFCPVWLVGHDNMTGVWV
jgi:hypothetical protein